MKKDIAVKLYDVDIFQHLDIKTDKGKDSLLHERIMLKRIKKSWGVNLIETDKDTDAKCDGIVEKNKRLRAIYESKCRDMNYMQLCKWGSWLVTNQKILDCQIMSKMLRVPFIGFLYLIPDEMIFYWKITNKIGDFNFEYEVRKTETQKTVNGGKIIRGNAFLPYKYAYEII